MKHITKTIAALALGFGCLASHAQPITETSPHYIVGEGTNICYFVLNWYGDAKLWGYRWRSYAETPTVYDALMEIDHEDHRLHVAVQSMTSSYVDIYFMGYDVNDSAPQWDTVNGCSSDPAALVGMEDYLYYSQWWVFYSGIDASTYGNTAVYSSLDAANTAHVEADKVYLFTIGSPEYDETWNESPATPPDWTPAESPYGYRVVDSKVASSTKALYKNPENVLHRPTCYMEGTWGGPVSPYNPAWMDGELLSLDAENCFVTIEFDHPVVDDPNNPWGIDLLVFGNAFGTGKTKTYYEEASHPGNWEFTGEPNAEAGCVEVSADGTTWYPFTNGPFCDDWAPTYGYIFDPANANTNLYAGNKWWSVTTDATWPVKPGIGWTDIEGLTIETLSYRYDKSAGGAGFDIGGIAGLPTDAKGRKYIKFVRISPTQYYNEEDDEWGWTAPDVDAVADVRPATEYERWKIENYTDWNTAWNPAISGKSAIAANGLPNAVNQVLGLKANESPVVGASVDPVTGVPYDGSLGFKLSGIKPGVSFVDLVFRSKKPLPANSGIKVKTSEDLSFWSEELPALQPSYTDGAGCVITPLRVSTQGRFFKLAIEE